MSWSMLSGRRSCIALRAAGALGLAAFALACSEGAVAPRGSTPIPAISAAGESANALDSVLARLDDAPRVAVGPLTNGQRHAGTIAVPLQIDTWTVAASVGDAISLNLGEVSGTANYNPWLRVFRPDGTLLGQSFATVAYLDFVATQAGAYTVMVGSHLSNGDDTGTGSYDLFLAQVPGAFVTPVGDQGGALTNGGSHAGAITIGDLDMWTLSANAGDKVSLSIAEVSGSAQFNPFIRIYAPDGSVVGQSFATVAYVDFTAAQTGTYTVIASTNLSNGDRTGTGDYVLYLAKVPGAFVVPPNDQGGALANGGDHPGTTTIGDIDLWTFSATTGGQISISMAEVSGTAQYNPFIRVYAPDGSLIGSSFATVAYVDLRATQTGTYTVVVASNLSNGDRTGAGDYVLRLAQAPDDFVVPPGDQGGTLANGGSHAGTTAIGDIDLYTFNGAVGDKVSLSLGLVSGSGTYNPFLRIYAPDGSLVGQSLATVAYVDFTATLAGRYTVFVASQLSNGDRTGTGDYVLVLAQVPGSFTVPTGDEGGAMTNGANHTGVTTRGDLDMWSFTASAGRPFAVSIGKTGGTANYLPFIRLYAPDGSLVASGFSTVVQLNRIATQTGTYTVVAGTNLSNRDRSGTGSYVISVQKGGAFSVSPGDEGGALVNGSNQTGSILISDLDRWTFPASQGEMIILSLAETSGSAGFTPWIRLVDPNGVIIGNVSDVSVAQVNLTAPATGTYTVVVGTNDAGNDDTGNYRLTVVKAPGTFTTPLGDEGSAISNGSVNGNIPVGDLDPWTVSAVQGSPITVTVTELTATGLFAPWIRLIGPNGAVLGDAFGSSSATININAPSTGVYTIVVATNDAGHDDTGTYRLDVAGVSFLPGPVLAAPAGEFWKVW